MSDSISVTKHYAATTDLWSSVTSAPYMTYTVHFIDQEWNLKSWCLQTLFVPQDHDADNLADVMVETLDNWGLDPNNQVCLTTDNGSNIVCATSERLKWNRLSCFGHNLHLAVVNSMKDDRRVARAFGVCRKLVELFAHSWKKKRELCEAQLQLKLPNHSLVSDCATRWGSKEKMVARVLEQEKAIRQVVSTDRRTSHLTPTWQDIDVLQSVHSAIKDLADFTDTLSGEDQVTLSALKAVLYLLKNQVLVESTTDTTLTKDIKRRILAYFNGKYSESETLELINLASFLDPRFITDYIEESELPSVIDRLIDESSGTEDHDDSFESTDTAEVTDTENAGPSTYGSANKRRKLSSWLNSARKASLPRASGIMEKAKREIETFQRLPRTDAEANPLKWWSLHASTYPILAALAKKYLCVPASSSSSERVFSTSGNIVSKKRSCLKPHKVDELVFLAHNLQ